MKTLQEKELAHYFDHTYLKADATDEQMKKLCDEALEIGACMVAINSSQTAFCHQYLKDTPVHVGAAISFPLGQTTIEVKAFETENAILNGADEIDYVVNLSEVKKGNWDYIRKEMQTLVDLCRKYQRIIKVIFENCYLNQEEKIMLSTIAREIKPDYIKTSTGFGTSGATVEDVKLMKEIVQDEVLVKAAGGIRDYQTCMAMIEAGASRIGTSSSLKILEEYRNENAH